MPDATSDFEKPARKATRAGKAAARDVQTAAKAVAQEARTFGRRSAKIAKTGQGKVARRAQTVRSAGDDAYGIAQARLKSALESLQASSEEMGRWAGARASEARDQTTSLVRERPLGSVGTVFAVGALIGVVASLLIKSDY